MQVEAHRGVFGCAQPGTIPEGGEEDVSGTAIGTVLSAGIVDVFSDEVVNAADLGGDAAHVYEKIDVKWLMVSHHVQPKPQ